MPRHISFENIYNFRDLGGYETPSGETSFSTLYRSSSLAFATQKDVEKLKKIGLKTIIDLRNNDDKKEHPDSVVYELGAKYIPLEVNGNGRIPTSRPDQIDSYMEMLEDKEKASKVFRAIMNEEKPLVFHCNAGKDRTGCFTMIILMAHEVPFEQINADYMLSQVYLSRSPTGALNSHPGIPLEIFYPNPFFLGDVKDRFLEIYGSVEDYFKYLGFSDEEYAKISSILV